MNRLKKSVFSIFFILGFMVLGWQAYHWSHPLTTPNELVDLFPLDHYNQNLKAWIKPSDPDFNQALLSQEEQQRYMASFLKHYVGDLSPWKSKTLDKLFAQKAPEDLKSLEGELISFFDNSNKPPSALGFSINFRPYSKKWITQLAENMNLQQFKNLSYQAKQRAITIDNAEARVLPTDDVYFFSPKRAGEGYPFDHMQVSSLWAGTPLYVLGESKDQSWSLVMTPELIGWIKSNNLAYADEAFIKRWTRAAEKNLAAIIHSQTPIRDHQGHFHFMAYLGSVFPAQPDKKGLKLLIPAADLNHQATIESTFVEANEATLMPLAATPAHFSTVMSTLIGRPYGWGGLYFYNDCSAELKNLYTPFGIWLPRHSSDQVNAGHRVDLSRYTPEQRLAYLFEHDKRFMTIIYIGGHVMLSLGTHRNPVDQKPVVMTYQNLWGLKPNPPTQRSVIGKAVLFPLLLKYPENPQLVSQAGKKQFELSFLDQGPEDVLRLEKLDIRKMMSLR